MMNAHGPQPGQYRLFWLALTGLAVATILGLIGAAVWGLARLLDVLNPVLWPLALGGVVACILTPLVDWLESRQVPRTRAIVLVFVVVCSLTLWVLAGVVPLVVVEMQDLISKIPEYTRELQNDAANFLAQPPAFLRQFLSTPPPAAPAAAPAENLTSELEPALNAAMSLLGTHWLSIGTWVLAQSDKVAWSFGILAGLGLVPVYAFYFLLESRKIEDRWSDYLPLRDSALKEEVVFVLGAISQYLVAFFRGQVLVALCDSVLYTLGFWLAGLNYTFLLGFVSVGLSLIPFLGAMVLALAAVLLALVQFGDWLHPLIVLTIFAIVQLLEGLVISPKIIGERVGLHPLIIIIAVMTGTTLLGGLLGGILAIPLAAALRVIMSRYVWRERGHG